MVLPLKITLKHTTWVGGMQNPFNIKVWDKQNPFNQWGKMDKCPRILPFPFTGPLPRQAWCHALKISQNYSRISQEYNRKLSWSML
jgi:hypothetical protein